MGDSQDGYLRSFSYVREAVQEVGASSELGDDITKFTIKGMGYLIDYRHIWDKPDGYEFSNLEFFQAGLEFIKKQIKEDLEIKRKTGVDIELTSPLEHLKSDEINVNQFLSRCVNDQEKLIVKAVGKGYPIKEVAAALEMPVDEIITTLLKLKNL